MRKSFLNEIKTETTSGNCFRLPSRCKPYTSYSSSMASAELRQNLLDWTESDVHSWLSSVGFPQYETQIRGGRPPTLLFTFLSTDRPSENNITGDVLVVLDADTLKEVGVTTIGQRLSILKHIYHAKLAHNVPIEPDHYIPPCMSRDANSSLMESHTYLTYSGDRRQTRRPERGQTLPDREGTRYRCHRLFQLSILTACELPVASI